MLLYPTNKHLAGTNVHLYTKFFPGVVEYALIGNTIVHCHQFVAVLGVPN